MPLLALLALLGVGGAGVYIGKKLVDDKVATSQQECFRLARQGKIDPRLCAKMNESSLAALADVAEEVGKAVVGAAVAYVVAKSLRGSK